MCVAHTERERERERERDARTHARTDVHTHTHAHTHKHTQYPGVAEHYAGTASSHCSIIVKRCLAKSAVSDEIPKGVKLRAIFMVINMFAHACGVEKLMRLGAAAETIDAALDLINSPDATMRMSAAAVLFNVSLYLPKEEGLEMVQISSGISHRLESPVDDETGQPARSLASVSALSRSAGGTQTLFFICRKHLNPIFHLPGAPTSSTLYTGFRLLLALGKLGYCNGSAIQLFKTLNLNLECPAGEDTPAAKNRRAIAGELRVLLDAPL